MSANYRLWDSRSWRFAPLDDRAPARIAQIGAFVDPAADETAVGQLRPVTVSVNVRVAGANVQTHTARRVTAKESLSRVTVVHNVRRPNTLAAEKEDGPRAAVLSCLLTIARFELPPATAPC